MFWLVNGFLAIGAFMTWTWKASSVGRSGGSTPRVVMLGREQTEEWKGWMQWAFIFYHYYRVYYVYNEIRLFVSAYVWMVSSIKYISRCIFDCCSYSNKYSATYTYTQQLCNNNIRLDSETSFTLIRRVISPLNDLYQ